MNLIKAPERLESSTSPVRIASRNSLHKMVRSKEEQQEDLEWFKSSFRPIPKPALPDDCVEYSLYILDSSFRDDNTRIVQRLREVQKASAEITKNLLKDYIWQREGYHLELAREDGLCQSTITQSVLS
jgi:hypothetical protein